MVIDIGLENRVNDTGFASRYIEECRFSLVRSMFRLTLPGPTAQKKQSDDDLHPGARHEKSPSRLRQRQNWQSHSDRHNADPS